MEKFSEDIERLAGEQRELTKASTKAKAAASRADTAVAKLRGKIADLEAERQVRGLRHMLQYLLFNRHAVRLFAAKRHPKHGLELSQSWHIYPIRGPLQS
jgi:hypothetical protein